MKSSCLLIVALCIFTTACGSDAPSSPQDGTKACASFGSEHPLTVLIVDVSGSTKDMRGPGGQFEKDWLSAACNTAVKQGTLWATTADSQTVANSVWQVQGQEFKPTIEDNDTLGAAEVRKQAASLTPKAREIVGTTVRSKSDLLGALQVASRLFRDYPDRRRDLVFLTDGGINVGKVDLRYKTLRTHEGRAKVIERLRDSGQLPDLTGGHGKKVRVWMGGLGRGIGGGDTRKTTALIEFWRELIPAAGGELVTDDSSLRLPNFP
jgi:hypothetical protein